MLITIEDINFAVSEPIIVLLNVDASPSMQSKAKEVRTGLEIVKNELLSLDEAQNIAIAINYFNYTNSIGFDKNPFKSVEEISTQYDPQELTLDKETGKRMGGTLLYFSICLAEKILYGENGYLETLKKYGYSDLRVAVITITDGKDKGSEQANITMADAKDSIFRMRNNGAITMHINVGSPNDIGEKLECDFNYEFGKNNIEITEVFRMVSQSISRVSQTPYADRVQWKLNNI